MRKSVGLVPTIAQRRDHSGGHRTAQLRRFGRHILRRVYPMPCARQRARRVSCAAPRACLEGAGHSRQGAPQGHTAPQGHAAPLPPLAQLQRPGHPLPKRGDRAYVCLAQDGASFPRVL